MRGIIRCDRNFKYVCAAHAFVHHYISINLCTFFGSQHRLTDDNLGWSATLQGGSNARHIKRERTSAGIRYRKTCADGTIKQLLSQIKSLGAHLELGCTGVPAIRC